jgi:beta-glucosidase
MYIRDLVGCRVRPVKELKGFKKVWLKAGEEKAVALKLPARSLAFHDFHMNKIVEPGRFKLWIAESSDDNRYEFDFEVK